MNRHPTLLFALALAGLIGGAVITDTVVHESARSGIADSSQSSDRALTGRADGHGSRTGADGLGTAPAPSGSTAPIPELRKGCRVDTRLVPDCGLLWGVAPGAFTDQPASQALRKFESTTGRTADILHSYHRGDEVFPTADELAVVKSGRRILFANWKVAWGTTWANVASGGQDARIDRLAKRLKSFPGKLFLALHHEPENDVNPNGGGMTATDFAAMYRHTVERLRAEGVTNVVFVMVYMAYEPWCVQPWFGKLWPGDDVVDWVGFDPYLFAKPGGYGHGDFAYLVNHSSDPKRWPGFYSWVTKAHGSKPLMIAEWGVYEYHADPKQKAWIFSTVGRQLGRFPAIKALVYFDSPAAPKGDTRPDSTVTSLNQFKELANSALFTVKL
jgi:hypothetical protein